MKDIVESEVDVKNPSRSGSNKRPPRKKIRVDNDNIDNLLEDVKDDPLKVSPKANKIIRNYYEGKDLKLPPEIHQLFVNYRKGAKWGRGNALPTFMERGIDANLLNPAMWNKIRIILNETDADFNIEIKCPDYLLDDNGPVCAFDFPKVKKLPKDPIKLKKWCTRCGGEEKKSKIVANTHARAHSHSEEIQAIFNEYPMFKRRMDDDPKWAEWIRENVLPSPDIKYPDWKFIRRIAETADKLPPTRTHRIICTESGLQITRETGMIVLTDCPKKKDTGMLHTCLTKCEQVEITRNNYKIPEGYTIDPVLKERLALGGPKAMIMQEALIMALLRAERD